MAGPLRVLYNATSCRVGGGLSYGVHQVRALLDQPGVELTVAVSPWNEGALREAVSGRAEIRRVAVRGAGARVAWEQVAMPWLARRHEVLVSPANFGTVLCPVPQVVVLQNANYVGRGRRLPQNAAARRRAKIAFSHLCMTRADRVVAISDDLAAEIASEPRLAGTEVVTVRSGVPEVRAVGEDALAAARELAGEAPFVLSVAHDYGHKRLDDVAALLPALDRSDRLEVPVRIVFVGEVSEERQEALRHRSGRGEGLAFLGPIAERETVLGLFSLAVAAVVTSELEAWSLTVHEATSQGCPVIASDLPAHREVGGDLATYVAVGDVPAMAAAVEDAAVRPRPSPAVHGHTWTEHGARLVEVLRSVVGEP